MNLSVPTAPIGEQQDAPFYARVVDKLNVVVVVADVYQVLVRVHDRNGTEVYGSEETPSDVFASVVATEPWTADGTGYNFQFTIPGRGVFLAGGGTYTAEFTVELNDGDTIPLFGRLDVRPSLTNKQNQTQ